MFCETRYLKMLYGNVVVDISVRGNTCTMNTRLLDIRAPWCDHMGTRLVELVTWNPEDASRSAHLGAPAKSEGVLTSRWQMLGFVLFHYKMYLHFNASLDLSYLQANRKGGPNPLHPISSCTIIHLLHGDGVRRSGEDGVGSSEGLGSGLQLGDVERVTDTLVGHEVVEKVHHVAGEVLNLGRGHKRVDGGVTVGARVQLPGGIGDRGGGDRGAGGGDGASAAESSEPHHDLVRVGAA